MGILRELVLPTDDRLVVVEVLAVAAVVAALGWRWRRLPDRRLLVWGMGLLALGSMALRALH